MKVKRYLYLIIIVAAGFITASLVLGSGRRPEKETGITAEHAPEIELTDLQGNISMLSNYRGKALLLNFWATWCPPCRYEKPFMQQIYDEYRDEGFVILAVSVREDRQTVQNYIDNHGYNYPVFLDTRGESFSVYNQSGGIPQTYLIDRRGRIHSFISGARDWTAPENRRLIEELLRTG